MWVESTQGVVLAVHELGNAAGGSVGEGGVSGSEADGVVGEWSVSGSEADGSNPAKAPDSRPTIIFCHATGMHAHTWLPVAYELKDDFRCVFLDFRGHGYTKTPEGVSFGWDKMRDDLLAVAAALVTESDSFDSAAGPARLLAVGHSMGGAVIVQAQLAAPGLFERAWLFEPILPMSPVGGSSAPQSEFMAAPESEFSSDDNSSFLAEGARRRRYTFASRQEAFDRYNSRPPLNIFRQDALRSYVEHGFEDLPDGRVALRCHPEHEAQTFEGALPMDSQTLEQVELPAAVAVSGDNSRPAFYARQAAQAMPQSELLNFDDLGHFGPQQDPVQTAHSIGQWLS